MRNCIASLLFLLSFCAYTQNDLNDIIVKKADTIVHNKSTNIVQERHFDKDLQDKYTGKDFEYTEEATKEKEETGSTGFAGISALLLFITQVFPYLLGAFLIFIILKTLIGVDIRFWKSSKSAKKTKEKLIYEDEDLHEVDLESLLQQALSANNFRLAIRYYYLTSLKGLSTKKMIDYHKDKTNTEYLFEIEDTALRNQFSYLSYVYSYVWYGEFPVEEQHFKLAQTKYQSFIKLIR